MILLPLPPLSMCHRRNIGSSRCGVWRMTRTKLKVALQGLNHSNMAVLKLATSPGEHCGEDSVCCDLAI